MNRFIFELGQKVRIGVSNESGTVVGRAEYTNSANNYRVRYQSADGRGIEEWWQEDALVSAED